LGDTKTRWTAEGSKRIHSVQQGIYELPSTASQKKVTKYRANCNGTRESTAYNMVFFGSVKIIMVPIQINLLYIEKSGLSFMLAVNIVQAQG
jgi:hypothetical protein